MEQSTGEAYYPQERESIGADLPRIAEMPENGNGHQPRVIGAPLSVGASGSAPQGPYEPKRLTSVPSPAPAPAYTPVAAPAPPAPPSSSRALANSRPAESGVSGLIRAVGLVRSALPFVHRLLPLLDGDFGTVVSNLIKPPAPPPPPAPTIDLAPLETTLTELKTQHRELREQFIEQNTSLKKFEDHLEMVREATDRNTLEQQELLEDLKTVGNKVNLIAVIAIGLLGISVVLNLLLFMHIQRVLP